MSEENGDFEALLQHIKEQRGFDFTGYKRASLARRVQRRMEAVNLERYDDYLDRLIVHPEEFTQLFNTILINVTSFFRDPDAWGYLQSDILPTMLRRRDGQPIRVWSAGCASGEEAYSLAMALAEELGIDEFRERVKIYATDVDEEALTQARHASYNEKEVEGVPEDLRERYFEPNGNRFVFRKELRRSVIFGRNDLVQDAPISHVDVLACRNTLMYFNAETQSQILNRMHFALRPDGTLFLGKAEMLLSHSANFRPVELKRRFFRKIPSDTRDRSVVLNQPVNGTGSEEQHMDVGKLRQAALMSSASAQIVLDIDGRLALSNNRAMQLFGLSPRDVGRPIQDLEVSFRPVELRAHIEEAMLHRRAVWIRDVEHVRGTGDKLSLDIQVVPLNDETGTHLGLTIIFNDVTQYRQLQAELTYANRQLEIAYEELQSTNEELETTNEELQSTVEELETTNEELQSTNEELETMNEELQSMNDELQFSNDALRDRQDEVERLNRFMGAVLGSMNSGVAVVDSKHEDPCLEQPRRRPLGCAHGRGRRCAPDEPRHRPPGGEPPAADPHAAGCRERRAGRGRDGCGEPTRPSADGTGDPDPHPRPRGGVAGGHARHGRHRERELGSGIWSSHLDEEALAFVDDMERHELYMQRRAEAARLREMSRSLRTWSIRVRNDSSRAMTWRHHAAAFAEAERVSAGSATDIVSLGVVSVRDLLRILTEDHGMPGVWAARELTVGLLVSGYPSEAHEVVAADAMEIIANILGLARS